MAWTCAFVDCRSKSQHSRFDTHLRCACGWVGVAHSRHVAQISAVRRGRAPRGWEAMHRTHRIIARQRLRRSAA